MFEYFLLGGITLYVAGKVVRAVQVLGGSRLKGFLGESRVNRRLNKLKSNGFAVLHDLLLPFGRNTSQIDHLVITRHGIFAIETKNYYGKITGSRNDKQWTQKYPSGRKRTFENPLMQNAVHVKAVRRLLSKYPNTPIHSLVVFSDNADFNPTPNVVKMQNLRGAILSRCDGEPVLTDAEVQDISSIISSSHIKGRAARRRHNSKAHLAAETAKHDHSIDIAKMYEKGKNAPLLQVSHTDEPKEHSLEYIKLTDQGAKLTIGKRTASILDFFESSKRDTSGKKVPSGSDFDHFVCPYTGDSFPKSEAKSFYQGLWISYLKKNPGLVEYMHSYGPHRLGGSYRAQKVLTSYCNDKDGFIAEARNTLWYKNIENKLSHRKHKDLEDQITAAKSKQAPSRESNKQNDFQRA